MTTYERRRAAHRCTRCNVPLVDGEGVCCDACAREHAGLVVSWQRRNPGARAAIQKRYKDRLLAARRAARLCATCGEPNDRPGVDRCSVCHGKAVDSTRRARARRAS